MSEKNHEGKRVARDRLVQQRERERARERRRRTLIVATAVVGVLALAAVVGLIAANAGKNDKDSEAGPAAVPSGATGKDGLALQAGADDAPSTLTIWEDFRCPVCAQFEEAFRGTIQELASSGQLKVEYHLATIIDGNLGGSGSLKAANAAACAQDVGKFLAYHDVLYSNQPPESDDAFGDNSKLIELAGKVEGLDTPGFRGCVEDGKHDSWVEESNTAFQNGGFQGTPTALLNGESIFPKKGGEQISVANLKKWVAEANKGKEPGKASGTPSAS